MPLRLLSGKEIIQQSLPELCVHENYRTVSTATHKTWFLANLAQWNIEQEARQYSASIKWKDDIYGHESDKERLYCGDEHSVVARFNQNLCHFLTCALHGYVREDIRFGDFKCAKNDANFEKVPDIVLFDKEHKLRVVGEAKTPWKHKFEKAQMVNANFRNLIGQIANYMHRTSRKYGFLTTYEETMFFQQVPHPKKKGVWVLRHSPAIRYNAKYEELSGEQCGNPIQYQGKVTLPECFMYLAKLAYEDGEAINPMDALSWVGPDTGKLTQLGDGYINEDESDSEEDESDSEEDESDSEEDESNEREDKSISQRMTRSATRHVDTLQAATERLDIQGYSHAFSTLEWKSRVTINFDRSRDRWYFTTKAKRVYVDLHQDPDEGEFFVAGNYRYPVSKI